MGSAVELVGLTKAFGGRTVVDRIDLRFPAGTCSGLLGPNGAGKTTMLAMATGLLRPDGGAARVGDIDVWSDLSRARRALGVMPQGLGLPDHLTGREALIYIGMLRGLDARTVEARAEDLLDVLDLPTDAEVRSSRLVAGYSTGMRKKLGLALALLHAPPVLVLDEPLEAVDPVSASTIKTILAQVVGSGRSVLLSSHDMALVEEMCAYVAIIADGQVRASGALDTVRGGMTLGERFVNLVGSRSPESPLSWIDAVQQ